MFVSVFAVLFAVLPLTAEAESGAVIPQRAVSRVRSQLGATTIYVPTSPPVDVRGNKPIPYRFTGWAAATRPPWGYQFDFATRVDPQLHVSFAVDVRTTREPCAGRGSQQGGVDRVFNRILGRRVYWQNTHSWEMAWWCVTAPGGGMTVVRAFTTDIEPTRDLPAPRLAVFVASARRVR